MSLLIRTLRRLSLTYSKLFKPNSDYKAKQSITDTDFGGI